MRKKSKSSFCQIDHLELRRLLSATLFVSAAAPGPTHDGSSWANAYTDLQAAMTAATSGTTIEVGQGTYKPTAPSGRAATFQLINGVTIQGGYAGFGQSNPDARDITLFPTILSGDIGTTDTVSDNSYHVVTGSGTNSTAVLDGFTISGGNADGGGDLSCGAGIFDSFGSPTISDNIVANNVAAIAGGGVYNYHSSPSLSDCVITGNSSADGGGMNNRYSAPTLTGCTLSDNSTTGTNEGGGMTNELHSSPTLTSCTITGNSADNGGGIVNSFYSSPTLVDCIISDNHATNVGAGVYSSLHSSPTITGSEIVGNSTTGSWGGGIADGNDCITTITDSSISGNTADAASAVYANGGTVNLINCTISGNAATHGNGDAIYEFSDASVSLTNCIVWGDTSPTGHEIDVDGTSAATVTFTDIDQSGYAGSNNNIDVDPQFIRAAGARGVGDFGDLRLSATSPAINAGSDGAINGTGVTTDLDGLSRIAGAHVDLGAYESHAALQSIIYVDATATGSGTGSDWTDAYPGLTAALDYAVSGETINVAQGTYTPSNDENRFDTFQLASGVSVEGGFAGQANPTAAQNVSLYPTILSGDIGDFGAIGNNSDNSYSVVRASGTDSTAVLDGFTITGGNANAANGFGSYGGGILIINGSPTITDCVISGNTALDNGGGIYNFGGNPTVTDCVISGNTASDNGGGIFDYGGSPTVTDCVISGNTAALHNGGGIYNYEGTPTVTDCVITENSATYGGGMYNYSVNGLTVTDCTITGNTVTLGGGGMFNRKTSATVINSVIAGNTAEGSGGIADFSSTLILTNCTISGNTATTFDGGGLYSSGGSTTLTNCVLWGDTAHAGGNEIQTAGGFNLSVANSDIDQSVFAGVDNNIDADPMFVRNVGANGPSDYGDLHLAAGSPAIDVGSNAAISGTTTDLGGYPRIVNSTVDLGAYEYQMLYVDQHASGSNDGSSWANAYTNLQSALAGDEEGTTIDVAQGTYYPTTVTDRTATFRLLDGVTIEGGFAGDTTANPGQRNVALFTTILSGDIGVAGDNSDNSYHVVTGSKTDNTATLDGFTITGGNSGSHGGGIANYYGSPSIGHCIITGNTAGSGGGIYDFHSSPVILDCTISSNTAISGGGIENNYGSSPILSDCTITGNTATGDAGGGIDNYYYSSPTLTNCAILQNHALRGGGLAAARPNSDPVLTDCIISGNTAGDLGGGLFNYSGTLSLINCAISGNTSEHYGGGIYSYANSSLTLTNCTISGNNAASKGGAIYNGANGSATVSNSILWGNTATGSGNEILTGHTSTTTVTFSDVQGGFTGTGNINADPLFVRAVGTNGPTDFGNLLIADSSPAVNVGSDAAIPNGVTTDLAGNTRIIASTVDMGAYEAQFDHLVFEVSPPNTNAAGHSFSFEVDIEDGNGNDVATDSSTVSVQITGNPSGATLNGSAMLAADQGQAIFSGLNITHPGTYTLSASDGTLPGATSNSFAITAGAPASLTITEQPTNTSAGQTISSIQVQAKDQYGNLADGSSIHVALATSPSGATLAGTTPTATSGGTATFSNLSLTTAGTYTLSISDGALPGVTSGSFTISPSAPATLIISQQPVDSIAGQNIPVQVEVEDQFGNLADGTSVTLSIASGPSGAMFSGTHTEPTTGGIATFSNLTLDRAGTFTLTASDGNLTALTSQSFTITYAGPQLVFVTEPASIVAGAKIPAFRVSPEDINGNPLLTNKSKITIRSSAGKLLGTSTASVKNGVAIFKNLSFQQAGSYTFQVTDSGFGSALSNTITVAPAAAAKMVFNPQPSSVVHGTPFNVTVELTDKYGNAVDDGSTVDLVLGSHPKTATSLNLDTSVSDGVADFDGITLGAAGNYTFKASDGKAKATSKKFVVS